MRYLITFLFLIGSSFILSSCSLVRRSSSPRKVFETIDSHIVTAHLKERRGSWNTRTEIAYRGDHIGCFLNSSGSQIIHFISPFDSSLSGTSSKKNIIYSAESLYLKGLRQTFESNEFGLFTRYHLEPAEFEFEYKTCYRGERTFFLSTYPVLNISVRKIKNVNIGQKGTD